MQLEARAANCCSSKFVLKLDGRPVGKFEGRWFSEGLDISMTARRHLQLRKIGWVGSQFELVDMADGRVLGQCQRSGFFTSAWDLTLSSMAGQLVRPGWFTTAYEFKHQDRALARVDRLGWCERGWSVDGSSALVEEDLLLIGLVFHTIQKRQASQHQAGGHAAGS
jgi:hypothetical protein